MAEDSLAPLRWQGAQLADNRVELSRHFTIDPKWICSMLGGYRSQSS